MHESIVSSATEILASIFEKCGWECNEGKKDRLKKAINEYYDHCEVITVDGISDLCYAVISRRALDKLRFSESPAATQLGKLMRQEEKKLYSVMMELGMTDFIQQTQNFSIILAGESRSVTEEFGTIGTFAKLTRSSRTYKVVTKKLYYSEGYGKAPHLVVSVETDRKEKRKVVKEGKAITV